MEEVVDRQGGCVRGRSKQCDSLLTTIRAPSWSAKHGAYPGGDPDLHHYVGSLLVKGAIDAFIFVSQVYTFY